MTLVTKNNYREPDHRITKLLKLKIDECDTIIQGDIVVNSFPNTFLHTQIIVPGDMLIIGYKFFGTILMEW